MGQGKVPNAILKFLEHKKDLGIHTEVFSDNLIPVSYTHLAAIAKLFCSEHANKTVTKALQALGGYGYTNDYPLERMMRDAKITEIYEGTSEVQRIVISGNLGL